MSGHSKFSNIQHRKNIQDKKRSKVFTKLIREILVAAKTGGGDVDRNPRLRAAVDKAFANNMSKDTIERAIKRGAGNSEEANLEEITYEGYGPNGVAVLVRCLTDNRNRTVAGVRHAFTKAGGNLGNSGSVAYLFSEKGQLIFPPGTDEGVIMELGINYNAEDVISNDDHSIEVITTVDTFEKLKTVFIKAGIVPAYAEVTMLASTHVSLDESTSEKVLRLIDMLEDLDDVQAVYTNADL
jgi:YebC/PmpR family DNA-binding regulatory protein